MSKHLHPIQKFTKHHSATIFIVAVSAMLSVALILCYLVYTKATTPTDTEAERAVPTSFDAKTEEALQSLQTRDEAADQLEVPTNTRINPFVE